MKKQFYNVCSLCGANLDPNEKCSCVKDAQREKTEKEAKKMADVFIKLANIKRRK